MLHFKATKLRVLFCAAIAAGGLTASASSAAVYYNDFATIGPSEAYGEGPYTHGGITIQYVGSGDIWTTFVPNQSPPGGYSWYPNGGGTGYDEITLTGGGSFTSVQLLVGSGWWYDGGQLDYELLNGATVVSSGDVGTLPDAYSGYATFTFGGGPWTALELQGPLTSTFSPSNYEALAIASITIGTGSVPEPSTWAMMLLGFAGLGYAGYRRARVKTQSA
jgi:PEP-CTERM motif